MSDKRIVEKQTENGFESVQMKDLRIGDKFRMFETPRQPIENGALMLATSDGFEEEGIGKIEVEILGC